jgi:hypothetical protein
MDNLITWNFQNEFDIGKSMYISLHIQLNMVLHEVKFNKDVF